MPVLTKKELIESIAELNDISKKEAENNVNGVFDTIKDALVEGSDVQIYGFGNFLVKETEERQGRNPATGKSITIPASRKLSFKPSKTLKDAIKE